MTSASMRILAKIGLEVWFGLFLERCRSFVKRQVAMYFCFHILIWFSYYLLADDVHPFLWSKYSSFLGNRVGRCLFSQLAWGILVKVAVAYLLHGLILLNELILLVLMVMCLLQCD